MCYDQSVLQTAGQMIKKHTKSNLIFVELRIFYI